MFNSIIDGSFLKSFYTFDELAGYFTLDTIFYVLVGYLFIFIAKWNYDKFQPNYQLDDELLEKDNKALAVSFLGYLLGLGVIIKEVLSSETSYYFSSIEPAFLSSFFDSLLWLVVGILLLNLSRVINNRIILRHFNNEKEIIKDKNIGTGMAQLGSYLSSGIIIASLISTEGSENIFFDLLETLFFFLITQFLLVIYFYLYNKITPYDLHEEIEKDNAAVGISLGFNLVAMGIILSFPIIQDATVLFFIFWFVNGSVLLILSRILLDKIIFYKSSLNDELVKDNNWGLALIEGSVTVIIAFIINASFF